MNPFHTWMRQCRKSGNKKCGFSIRVNAMITDFFLFLLVFFIFQCFFNNFFVFAYKILCFSSDFLKILK